MQMAIMGDIAEVFNGKTPAKSEQREGGHPVLKIRDVDALGNIRGDFASFVDAEFATKFRAKHLCEGDTLILNAAHNSDYVASKTFYASHNHLGPLITGEWTVVRPDSALADSRYVRRYIESPDAKRLIKEMVNGIHLYPKDVARCPIPLPPLPEQRRIAAILDKADALRAKRREAITKLDQMLQSVFLEMFGDPVTNPKEWPMKFFGEVCESSFRNGLSPSTSGSVPGKVLTLSAITRQHFQSHHQKKALFDRPPSDNQQVKMDTFLICRGNGNRQLVGAGVFPNHDLYDVCFPDTMIGANINKNCASPRFIEQIWGSRFVRNQIESGASTTNGTFKINQKTLEKILIPIPPLELQAQFESISTKLMTLRARMSVHSGLIDENFRSLQQRMFGAL